MTKNGTGDMVVISIEEYERRRSGPAVQKQQDRVGFVSIQRMI
ncbi:hypothetical protein [Brevibacillus ruminantium]